MTIKQTANDGITTEAIDTTGATHIFGAAADEVVTDGIVDPRPPEASHRQKRLAAGRFRVVMRYRPEGPPRYDVENAMGPICRRAEKEDAELVAEALNLLIDCEAGLDVVVAPDGDVRGLFEALSKSLARGRRPGLEAKAMG